MEEAIIGWAHLPFGRTNASLEDLIVAAGREALAHAGVEAADVDAVFVATMNGGFVRQGFAAALALQMDPALRFKPATRVENACASGSAAIHAALDRLAAGRARVALVIGAEKMTEVESDRAGEVLLGASYVAAEGAESRGFAGIFARIAALYFERHGDRSDALARIAAKNHENGARNPLAHFRKPLSYEFCSTVSARNPHVAGALRRTDCSAISDGAAALVLASRDAATGAQRAVRFRAATHVNDFLPMASRDVIAFEGAREAWRRALATAGCGIWDLSCIETHDCFTVAELIEYEAMGLTAVGDGARAIDEGWTVRDGRLPVNLSGGLKAKGHPIGATGVAMHVTSCMQLLGEAGEMQLPGASLAGVFNMGGTAVANYVSILEAVRA